MSEVAARQRVDVRPTGAALGADIEGVDLSQPLDPAVLAAIKQAWAEHLVLRFRGQRLDDDQLMRFSAQFGDLDRAPVIAAARVRVPGEDRWVDADERRGNPYVSVISNIIENGVAIGALGAYEESGTPTCPTIPNRRWRARSMRSRCRPKEATPALPTCTSPTRPCPTRCGGASRGGIAATIRVTTAPANCAGGSPRSPIRGRRPAPTIRSCGPIR